MNEPADPHQTLNLCNGFGDALLGKLVQLLDTGKFAELTSRLLLINIYLTAKIRASPCGDALIILLVIRRQHHLNGNALPSAFP
jgi:hypothetical protein